MAYGTLAVDTVQSSTAGTPVQFNDGNGTQVGTLCRAWVNFNGVSGSVAIRASFNVSSISRTGTGTYTVSFTNAFPDANYCVVLGGDNINGVGNSILNTGGTYSASSISINLTSYSNTSSDDNYINIAIFR